jgi:hypothetical protein
MNELPLWLVGSGGMAQDYAKVLVSLNQTFKVRGRGKLSAQVFQAATGHTVRLGGIRDALSSDKPPQVAIVAVDIEELKPVAEQLILSGTKKILLEKPGSINLSEAIYLNDLARQYSAKLYIAYNRRFYQSVQQVRQIIADDDGILSIQFDFTEWSHLVAPLQKAPVVKEHWLLGNSSHVIDLVFHLCGRPDNWNFWHLGSLDWHPSAARFCGAGITELGIMFSYMADWQTPGRWGVDIMTKKNRLILRPMEKLQVMRIGSIALEEINLGNQLDSEFKPGLFLQTESFLKGNDIYLCTLQDQVENLKIYSKIAGYI